MKRLAGILMCMVLAMSLFAGCSMEGPVSSSNETVAKSGKDDGNFKVGITLQSLSNDYFAGVFGEVETLIKEKGWDYTIVDCQENSAEQISQIENFISSGCDLIMVHAADPNSIEDICKKAMESGIKVMSWDDSLVNSDVNWVIDNTELGRVIGKCAAEFINEHYSEDNKAQVTVINYPQLPIVLARGEGIIEGLKDAEGNYEIVAEQPAIEANKAQSAMETILQSHPDCRVVVCTGSGPDIGANEALKVKTQGNIPEDMGIFSADAVQQQLEAILSESDASNTSVGFEGSNKRTAEAVVDIYEQLLNGETFESQDLERSLTVINKDNAEEFLKDYQ